MPMVDLPLIDNHNVRSLSLFTVQYATTYDLDHSTVLHDTAQLYFRKLFFLFTALWYAGLYSSTPNGHGAPTARRGWWGWSPGL